MLGHADVKTTQIYHLATHPAQLPEKDGETKPDEPAREELLNAPTAEQDEEEEQEP